MINSALSAAANTNAGGTAAQRQTQLDSQSFMQLLTAQMSNQNPLDPMDDKEYFTQLAQLGQVQSLEQIQSDMKLGQVQALMGKQVSATVDNNGVSSNMTGTVVGSTVQNGDYLVSVSDSSGNVQNVPLANIQSTSSGSPVTSYAQLIGQQATGFATTSVNGTSTPITASGQIVGITTVNGQPTVRIQTSSYGVVNVSLSNISQLGK